MPRLPQTLSLHQLEPCCVKQPTSIRITNKLSLKSVYYRATIPFEVDDPSPSMECGGLPPLFLLPCSGTLRSSGPVCSESVPSKPGRTLC